MKGYVCLVKVHFCAKFVCVRKYAAKRLLIDSNEDRDENEKISVIRLLLLPLHFAPIYEIHTYLTCVACMYPSM